MFVSLIVIALYFLPYLISVEGIGASLIISDYGAILAATTFVIGFISYLWAPHLYIKASATVVYLLMVATAGALIVNTGGPLSAFVSIWIVLGVFASVFGVWGVLSILLASSAYAAYLYLSSESPSVGSLIMIGIIGIVPLIASYIIFHSKQKKEVKDDAAYHELATELSQATNKSDVVINAIDDGVIAIDSKGNIELMNPAAQKIIGWGDRDALKLHYRSVLKLTDSHDTPLDNSNDPILQVLSTNKDVHTKQFYLTTNSGKRLIASLVISPIGQLGQGAIIAFRDITREQAEEREQAEFISTASHEMRTPVASIEGYLGLALNPHTAQIDEKARDYIEKAHESAEHLGRLFQDLLDVSKADDGRLSNHPAVVDIGDFAGDIVEGLRPKAEEKQLRIYYKPQGDAENSATRNIAPVFYATVDNDHLREVISNLVENAIKYTLKGDVIVDVTGDEEHVKISIQDSGIGIPLEDIPHLFQKFYRVDNSSTREIGGTGLGLYLCRRLAEVMGGRIWLESEYQKGSTFYLELPRTPREEALRLLDAAATEITPETSLVEGRSMLISDETPGAVSEISTGTNAEPTPETTPVQPLAQQAQTIMPDPAPVAVDQTQQQATPPAVTVVAPTLENIEQDPGQYTQQRPGASIQIPVRDPTGKNQS